MFLCTGTARVLQSHFIFTACKFERRAQMSLLVARRKILKAPGQRHYYIAHQACSSTFLYTWLYCLLVSHSQRIFILLYVTCSLTHAARESGPSLNFTTANHLCARATSDPDAPRTRKFAPEFYEIQHFHERDVVGCGAKMSLHETKFAAGAGWDFWILDEAKMVHAVYGFPYIYPSEKFPFKS